MLHDSYSWDSPLRSRSSGCLRRPDRRVSRVNLTNIGSSTRWAPRRGECDSSLRDAHGHFATTVINIFEWRPPTNLYASWNRCGAFHKNTEADSAAVLFSPAWGIFDLLANENKKYSIRLSKRGLGNLQN